MYAKYRNTAVISQQLAQSVAGLLTTHRLTADVRCATFMAPLRFHPFRDRVFYTNRYWCDAEPQEEIAASQVVLQKFHSWLAKAGPMERTRMTVAALLDSYDSFEGIVDDALLELNHRHRAEYIDADDSLYYMSDFNAVRDPKNIQSVLDTERVAYFIEQFQQQARRAVESPPVDYDAFQKWDDEFNQHYEAVQNQFRHCTYSQHGFTVKQGRHIVTRSWRLLVSMIGAERTRDFVGGHEIYLRGPKLIWGLKMHSNKLIDYTLQPPTNHCPYRMTLYNDQMQKLAECCVLFKGIPVLDQAVGIVLGLCNPEEEINLLRDCNVFQYTKAGKRCDLLRPYNKDREWEDMDPFDLEMRTAAAWDGAALPARSAEGLTPIRSDPALDDDCDGTETLARNAMQELYEDWDRDDQDDPFLPRVEQRHRRFFQRVGEIGNWRREQRRHNPVTQLLQQHLFDRIGGPRELVAYMADPEVHHYWYGPRSRRLPERVISYISGKVI